jgi:predicted NodU family carbamoyl transferase
MRILSYNAGHDGAVALLEDAKLTFSIEAEKDSNYRHAYLTVPELLDSIAEVTSLPDVICMSGWWPRDHHEYLHGSHKNGGYRGLLESSAIIERKRLLGGRCDYFSSSHERSHILCAFGMSPLPERTPCYALVWEGELGAFYAIDEDLNIILVGDVLNQVGNRYAQIFGLADPTFPKDGPYPRQSDAGKLMALASFATRTEPTAAEAELTSFLLDGKYHALADYPHLADAPHLNVGVDDPEFRNFAGIYSDAIFERFHRFAVTKMEPGLPLVIAGGCGLNCDWNTRWRQTGFFSDIFVPPVANDSGSAIGTAIDAQFRFSGNPKIGWDVYSGSPFRADLDVDLTPYEVYNAGPEEVAKLLADDMILGWVTGRCEIGPRALGNRSILAAPFRASTRERLNKVKQREQYRPIAPTCLRREAERWFACREGSSYMLFTYKATTDALRAVTHVNGTARLQTVTTQSNARLADLLAAFQQLTGYGVLCNTSLNFSGKGLVNNLVDMDAFTRERGLDGFVIDGSVHLLRDSHDYEGYSSGRAP